MAYYKANNWLILRRSIESYIGPSMLLYKIKFKLYYTYFLLTLYLLGASF